MGTTVSSSSSPVVKRPLNMRRLLLTVVPMVDLLPSLLRGLVSKKTILNMLNLDSVKSEIMGMSDETARFYVKLLQAIPKKERDEGLALLKVLETMMKLAEEDAD